MATTISREYWFSAAHRLEGHPKCGRLHGHNYRVVVTLIGMPHPETGMVLDYGELDRIVKPFLDKYYDHKYIVSRQNEDAQDPYAQTANVLMHAYFIDFPASTAEYIAQDIYQYINQKLSTSVLKVQVDETPKSTATYFGENENL